jgi:hypothetical protein
MKNDSPHSVGDHVWINRYEHGWDVGSGVVKSRERKPNGVWTYVVTTDVAHFFTEAVDIDIKHTRDIRRIP